MPSCTTQLPVHPTHSPAAHLSIIDSKMSDKSPTSSPPHISSPSLSQQQPPSPKTSPNPNRAASSAAIAAAIDTTRAHQHLFPGLATLFLENGTSLSHKAVVESDSLESPFPSIEAVSAAALRSISDFPPYVTMNVRDSAPQLSLMDPTPAVGDMQRFNSDSVDFSKTVRRMVVRGGMRGYRMSRASHGVNTGCYYYEAIVLGSKGDCDKPSLKRSREEMNASDQKENPETSHKHPKEQSNTQTPDDRGHLRMGWSARLGDLQAPVGYDKHSYAIRDIMGSRIHNSRREDKWGGLNFERGDVVGFAICLGGKADTPVEGGAVASDDKTDSVKSNYICFYKNGIIMGEADCMGIAFDNITPDTYFPAVSCYLDGSVQLNFGPHFIYPPKNRLSNQCLRPISDLCPPPPTPEEAEEIIISSSKEGRKIFLSKRTDEGIVLAFKQLVKTEAMVRRDGYLRHLSLHRGEIEAMRKQRGLSTADLFDDNKMSE